jgi:hypothetical protein
MAKSLEYASLLALSAQSFEDCVSESLSKAAASCRTPGLVRSVKLQSASFATEAKY